MKQCKSLVIILFALSLHVPTTQCAWLEQVKIITSDSEDDDKFGVSISIIEDYAIIGAYWDNNKSGSAYIFKKSDEPDDPNWYEQAKLTASDAAARDFFGTSVSISGDYAVVGARGDDDYTGSAYIFNRSGTNWTQQTKLTAWGGATNSFGCSVSISGDYVIVGTVFNSAYIYKRDGENWLPQDKLTNDGEFGRFVSISENYAIVGAWEDWDDDNGPYSGSAYIFSPNDLNPSSWDQQARLTASDGAENEYFGASVSISEEYAIVGTSYDTDKAYIFRNDGTNWLQQAKLIAPDDDGTWQGFGASAAIRDGYAFVGALRDDENGNNSGATYVFQEVCPTADLNSDCFVDFIDLCILAGQWLQN